MPTCCGCFVTPPQQWGTEPAKQPAVYGWQITSTGLTNEEKECLKHLADAWDLFSKMNIKHPDDDKEFKTAIHDAQKMIALRVARRIDTNVWKQPEC